MKLKVFFKRYILVTFIICIAVFMILSITGYYVCGNNIDIANNLIGAFMDIFNSISKLFFKLVLQVLSFSPLFYMILGAFVITALINIFCYMLWGRY